METLRFLFDLLRCQTETSANGTRISGCTLLQDRGRHCLLDMEICNQFDLANQKRDILWMFHGGCTVNPVTTFPLEEDEDVYEWRMGSPL